MTKSLIAALAVVGLVATAHAGESSQGLSNSLQGSANMVGASLEIVFVDGSGKALALSSTGAKATGHALKSGGLYILNTTPSQMSQNASASTSTAAKWVVTTTGEVLRATFTESGMILENPSKESRRGLDASATGIECTIDASGRVLTKTGHYLTNRFGNPITVILTGSGQVYTATEGAIVTAFVDSKDAVVSAAKAVKATVTYVANGVATSTVQSASDARYALIDLLNGQVGDSSAQSADSVTDASRDLVTGGRQY